MRATKFWLGQTIFWIVRPFELICAATLFVMMMLTFLDVCGRYLLGWPVPGAFEVTETLLATLLFAGLPALTRQDGHVVVDLLPARAGAVARVIGAAIINISLCLMLSFLAFHLWIKADYALKYDESTAVLQFQLAPVVYFMSIMTFLSAAICLARAFGVHQDGGPATARLTPEEAEL